MEIGRKVGSNLSLNLTVFLLTFSTNDVYLRVEGEETTNVCSGRMLQA